MSHPHPTETPGLDAGCAARLARVRAQIDAACRAAGRAPRDVTLVAASKTIGAKGLAEAIAAGQIVFGENRVQEAAGKWPDLREAHPELELHLIGPLQSNKAREAVALFDVLQSVDRPSLCAALAREIARLGRRPRIHVQVNIGREPQKGGVLPEEADALVEAARETHGLEVTGLMCIPPVGDDPRRHFEALAAIARRHALPVLSMGMSADFAEAIACGATHVRVGSAIFVARPSPAAA